MMRSSPDWFMTIKIIAKITMIFKNNYSKTTRWVHVHPLGLEIPQWQPRIECHQKAGCKIKKEYSKYMSIPRLVMIIAMILKLLGNGTGMEMESAVVFFQKA